jgi:hypothetical protein
MPNPKYRSQLYPHAGASHPRRMPSKGSQLSGTEALRCRIQLGPDVQRAGTYGDAQEDGSGSRQQHGIHNNGNDNHGKAQATKFSRPPLPTNRDPWSPGDQHCHPPVTFCHLQSFGINFLVSNKPKCQH